MEFEILIEPKEVGQRLDSVIANQGAGVSRSQGALLIRQGKILVNGGGKRPSYKVHEGDLIKGVLPGQKNAAAPEPVSMDLDICYEDDHILVVNKPPGLVVHPGAGNMDNTLVNGLLAHCPSISSACEDPMRPGIVHRLDKDTSGIMVVAKTLDAFGALKDDFFHHRVKKHYQALVLGRDLAGEGVVEWPMGRHPVKRKQMCVDREGGRPAKTQWLVLDRFASACRVKVRLHTGRTHQIRLHFYAMGYPLMGDPVYQFRRNRRKNKGRQMLHAWQLSFSHPMTGEALSFEADPPDDFKGVWERLKREG